MKNQSAIVPLTLLAGASGARSMIGMAAVACATESRFTRVAGVAAAGELIGDKLPSTPNRTDLGPIVGRAVAGAIIGAAIANDLGKDRARYAIAGAAIAFISAHLSFRFRRGLSRRVAPVAAALIEDTVILAVAAGGASRLR